MKIGRPTFRIDPIRLKLLREEKGLKQRGLAYRVYERLGNDDATIESMERHYQRVEKRGATSHEFAKAIADELCTTIAVLQGMAPEESSSDRVDKLEQHLRVQLAQGGNDALEAAMAAVSESENPIRSLAVDLSEQIELAQFGQHTERLKELSLLTGWTMDEVQKSISVRGYWLLFCSMHGAVHPEIISGVTRVLQRIEEDTAQYGFRAHSDSHITLREEAPWFRASLESPRLPLGRLAFSFVRCVSHPSGLKYVAPTWQDRFFLEDPLMQWAFTTANFVVGMNGEQWPSDLRQLRLLVEAINDQGEMSPLAVVEGDINELSPERLAQFQAEGNGHDLVTSWLSSGLWDTLGSHLAKWPRSCWKVKAAGCIYLELDAPLRLIRTSDDPRPYGVKYCIRLVEKCSEGYRPAPWRHSSMALVKQWLEKDMDRELPEEAAHAEGQKLRT